MTKPNKQLTGHVHSRFIIHDYFISWKLSRVIFKLKSESLSKYIFLLVWVSLFSKNLFLFLNIMLLKPASENA